MSSIRFFNPGLGYSQIRKEVLGATDRVLTNGDLILREDTEKFEKHLADFCGTKYAIGLNSCTDALYLALRGLGIGPGDFVLVPSRTFVASVQVIKQVGAEPIFYDLDGALPIDEIRNIKAIIPVHIEGAFDTHFDHILKIAEKYGWHVIEDAAQALGAVHNSKKAGSFGIAGCFSFYPAKILGAYGDAGALVTNDEKMYNYVKDARNHFKTDARDWGVNSRLDNLQAAYLNIKFRKLGETLERRKQIAEKYTTELGGISGLELPRHTDGRVWQDYIVRTEKRDMLYDYLKEVGVETMKNNYPFPVPKLPMAQKYEDETLRLPCNELLTDEEVDYVIKMVRNFYEV